MLLTEWHQPEEGVFAQHSSEVLAKTSIVWLVFVKGVALRAQFLAELYRCVLVEDQVGVEAEEHGDEDCQRE